MESIGFEQGVSNPCLYVHDEFSLRCNVHGDDFTVVGSYDKLQWLIKELKKAWTIEVRGILARPGSRLPNVCHKISVLNRLVSWTEHGIELEADPRHVELVLEQLGLEKAAPVTTPLVKSKGDEEEVPLTDQEAGYYRSVAMRIGYLSMDRPDMLRLGGFRKAGAVHSRKTQHNKLNIFAEKKTYLCGEKTLFKIFFKTL